MSCCPVLNRKWNQTGRHYLNASLCPTSTPDHVLRLDVANRLEKSLQQGWEVLAVFENQLAQDDTVPEPGPALDSRRQELVVSLGTLGLRSPSVKVLPPQHLWTEEGTRAGTLQVWNACTVPNCKLQTEAHGTDPSCSWCVCILQ